MNSEKHGLWVYRDPENLHPPIYTRCKIISTNHIICVIMPLYETLYVHTRDHTLIVDKKDVYTIERKNS